MAEHLNPRIRWLALMILCVGDLMIVVDTTVVNVALPSIRSDLRFSQTSLAWVVNAYMLTFGGFLLLGGPARRPVRPPAAVPRRDRCCSPPPSLVCGVSTPQGMLIAARAVQGLGGAVVSAVAFSLIVVLFTEPAERAKAMGVFGFVMAGGGSIGVLLGGVLTDLAQLALDLPRQPADRRRRARSSGCGCCRRCTPARERRALDVAGAVTITAALVLAVYAIVNGNSAGWTSAQTLGLLAAAVVIARRVRRAGSRGSARR